MYSRIILSLLLFLLFSCSALYRPSAFQTPLFEKENDFRMALRGGVEQFDLQTGYAFSDKMGAIVGYSTASGDTTDKHFHNYIEVGLTYRLDIKHYPLQNIFLLNHLEFLAGLGYGSSYGKFRLANEEFAKKVSGKYANTFIQLNLAYTDHSKGQTVFSMQRQNSFTAVGIMLKANYINYNDFTLNDKNITGDVGAVFIETGIFNKFGWEKFFFEVQTSTYFDLSRRHELNLFPLQLSLGLNLAL